MEINPVKGTHDIIGSEANLYTMIEQTAMLVAGEFGYQEIRTPIIEHTPLFLRSVGEWSMGLKVPENSILQAYYQLIDNKKVRQKCRTFFVVA